MKMLSIREAADLTGLKVCAVRRIIAEGKVPHIRIGQKFMISDAALLRYLEEGDEAR